MIRIELNKWTAILPLICSAAAFLIVMANIVAGVHPQPDENASAHLWQLLMAVQLPLIAVFIASANWHNPRRPGQIVALQTVAIVAAALPVWLAGY